MTKKYYRYKDSHRTVRGVKEKRCPICEKWKPESDFSKDRARKDGLRSRCKECNREYERKLLRKKRKGDARQYLRFEDRHRTVRGVQQKLCIRCKEWRNESEFHKSRRLRDGLSLRCKGCSYKPINKPRKPKKKSVRKTLRYEDRHRVFDGVKQKLCHKCKRWKDESEFYKNRSIKDGLNGRCRECSYRATSKPRHRIINGAREKLCCKCEKWKKESDFYKNRLSKDGLKGRCRTCSYKPVSKPYDP